MRNYKHFQILILIISSIVGHEGNQMFVFKFPQFYSFSSSSSYAQTIECIASWIGHSFKVVNIGVYNTTTFPMQAVEHYREPQRGKQSLASYINTKPSEMTSIYAIYSSTYHTKQLNPL